MAVTEQRRTGYLESALIPKERYTSPEWLAAEYERLWPLACRVEELPVVDDFVEYTIGALGTAGPS